MDSWNSWKDFVIFIIVGRTDYQSVWNPALFLLDDTQSESLA